jgi:CRP/FNR family transcriptional regulator, cyclic AMP receptor protein
MALTHDERLQWLREVPLFRGCAEASLRRLAERTTEVEFRTGTPIVQQGQVGNGLLILVVGSALVQTGDQELARLGPGEVIGELSVIDQEPRMASVTALEPSICLALASWDLLEVLDSDPQLARNLLAELAGRLRAADARIGE